jgi:hypothetical protein
MNCMQLSLIEDASQMLSKEQNVQECARKMIVAI